MTIQNLHLQGLNPSNSHLHVCVYIYIYIYIYILQLFLVKFHCFQYYLQAAPTTKPKKKKTLQLLMANVLFLTVFLFLYM